MGESLNPRRTSGGVAAMTGCNETGNSAGDSDTAIEAAGCSERVVHTPLQKPVSLLAASVPQPQQLVPLLFEMYGVFVAESEMDCSEYP
jgi:hypothetical protein